MHKIVSLQQHEKLTDLPSIYAYIKPRVCQIITAWGESGTGFFIKANLNGTPSVWILTCLHLTQVTVRVVTPKIFATQINTLIQKAPTICQANPTNKPIWEEIRQLQPISENDCKNLYWHLIDNGHLKLSQVAEGAEMVKLPTQDELPQRLQNYEKHILHILQSEYTTTPAPITINTAFGIFEARPAILFPQYDMAFFQTNIQPKSYFELDPNLNLIEGDKVYFGGYPLTQSVPTFHKGAISSLFTRDDRQFLTVDATTVPGYSGSPILVLRNGKLIPAAIVNVMVVDAVQEFRRLRQNLAHTQGSLTFNKGPITVDPLQGMGQIMDFIQRNLATGIGKGLLLSQLFRTFHPTTPLDVASDFEIKRPKTMPPAPRPPSLGVFYPHNKDIETTCLESYVPHKLGKYVGKKQTAITDEFLFSIPKDYANSEGDIISDINPHRRLDLQSPRQFALANGNELDIHNEERIYACWQFQFGIGQIFPNGGAFCGVLMLTDTLFTVKEFKTALQLSFQNKTYAILTMDKNGKKQLVGMTQAENRLQFSIQNMGMNVS